MKKTIKVSIPEPCHENWGKMTQTEKGKFCQVCTKEVIDFTQSGDEDIVKHVLKHNNTCGRFSKSQLDRALTLERSSGQRLAPLAASILLPLTMMASSVVAPKQGGVSVKNYTSLGIGSLHKQTNRIQVTLQGKVTDTHGNALVNVRIIVEETGKKVVTDSNGNYSITFLNKDTLLFIIDGFEIHKHKAGNKNETYNPKMIALMQEPMIMGEIAPEPFIEKVEKVTEGDTIKQDSIITITGVITDEGGLPLPGVNVIVKETNNGTQSDFDGNFAVNTYNNAVLTISYLGYKTEEIQLSNINNTIDISMKLSSEILGRAIVVGYVIEPESFSPFRNFRKTKYTPEQIRQRAARKKTKENGLAFKKLKMARKKEARKQKRASRKK